MILLPETPFTGCRKSRKASEKNTGKVLWVAYKEGNLANTAPWVAYNLKTIASNTWDKIGNNL